MTNELRNPVQKLWQDQPVEGVTMSVEVIRKRAAKFERKIRWRNVREYVAALIAAVPLGYFFVTARDVFARITFGLLIGGLAWMVVQLHRKGSVRSMPTEVSTLTSLQFYRAELERQREAVNTVWSWYLAPLIPGLLVYTVWSAIRSPRPSAWLGLALLDAVIAGMFYVIWKMNVRAARCLQRMIDELKAENLR